MAKRKELVTDAMHEFGLLTTSRKQQIENCQLGIPSMKRRYHLLHISQKINERTTIKAREQEKNRQFILNRKLHTTPVQWKRESMDRPIREPIYYLKK